MFSLSSSCWRSFCLVVHLMEKVFANHAQANEVISISFLNGFLWIGFFALDHCHGAVSCFLTGVCYLNLQCIWVDFCVSTKVTLLPALCMTDTFVRNELTTNVRVSILSQCLYVCLYVSTLLFWLQSLGNMFLSWEFKPSNTVTIKDIANYNYLCTGRWCKISGCIGMLIGSRYSGCHDIG